MAYGAPDRPYTADKRPHWQGKPRTSEEIKAIQELGCGDEVEYWVPNGTDDADSDVPLTVVSRY